MKLISDAMRKGARDRGQAFGEYFQGSQQDKCCAMGAVIVGLGIAAKDDFHMMSSARAAIKHLVSTDTRLVAPIKAALASYNHSDIDTAIDLQHRSIGELIVHANDYAKLPISEIADLVEAGEKAWMEASTCATS